MIGHLGNLSDNVQPVAVCLIYLMLTALLASVPTSIARWRILGAEHRLVGRYRNLPDDRRDQDVREDLSLRAIGNLRRLVATERLGRWFGGEAVRWSPSRVWVHPGRALRLLPIVLAASVTTWSWPTPEVAERLRGLLHWISTDVRWDGAAKYLALTLLVIAALMALPRTSILDLVRARDEAAKDANRLLTELGGQTSKLYYSATLWAGELGNCSAALVDGRVDEISAHNYCYIRPEVKPARWLGGLPRGGAVLDSSTYEADLDSVQHVLERIQDLGLSHVAVRLASGAAVFLDAAEAHLVRRGMRLSDLYATPDTVERTLRNVLDEPDFRVLVDAALCTPSHRLETAGVLMEDEMTDDERARVREVELERVGRKAGRACELLELHALRVQFRADSLFVATNLLTRRPLGSPWVRLASLATRA